MPRLENVYDESSITNCRKRIGSNVRRKASAEDIFFAHFSKANPEPAAFREEILGLCDN